ncbi:hypothetical protein ACH5RR_032342, partial [Cinchona calisaya]
MHAFLMCPLVACLWDDFEANFRIPHIHVSIIQHKLQVYSLSSRVRDDRQLYTLVPTLTLWNIWKHKTLKPIVPLTVLWEPPPLVYLNLNVDGSSLCNPGVASGGGIVLIASSLPFVGFSTAFGVKSNMEAETLALET